MRLHSKMEANSGASGLTFQESQIDGSEKRLLGSCFSLPTSRRIKGDQYLEVQMLKRRIEMKVVLAGLQSNERMVSQVTNLTPRDLRDTGPCKG